MAGPLSGVRVLDFTRVLSGPYGTLFLADMGADVVKVEHPVGGDDTRAFGPPFVDGVSTYFLSVNRGKRSITLDLKSSAGRDAARALAAVADVVVENFRPGVMERLGLGPDDLRAGNAGLIYCRLCAFADPEDTRPGYDLAVQGMSGIPSITGPVDGPPSKTGASIADLVCGLNTSQGVLAALYRRERTGVGGVVTVPMMEGMLSLLTWHASAWLNGGKEPARLGNFHPSIHPFCAYQAADGHLNLCVGNDAIWGRFCRALGHPEWADEPRFQRNRDRVVHRADVDALLIPIMAQRTVAQWQADLDAAGVPCGPMWSVQEALAHAETVTHPHPETGAPMRTLPNPIRLDGEPIAAARRAPALGEHQDEVLQEWLGSAGGAATASGSSLGGEGGDPRV